MPAMQGPEQFTWAAEGRAKFESDWMALHRFLWMNALDAHGYWSVLRGGLRRAKELPTPRARGRMGDTLATRLWAAEDFTQHFTARSAQACLGESISQHLLESNAPIRFCPECLRHGFHSPLFQLLCVKRCPQHDCDLRETCEKCGQSLGHVRLELVDFVRPLGCPRCGAPFCGERPARAIFSGQEIGAEQFSKAEVWLKQVSFIRYCGSTELPGNAWMSFDFAAFCACLVLLRTPQGHMGACPPADQLVEAAGADAFDEDCGTYRARRHMPLNGDLAEACANAKAIGRQLGRRVQAICGHRKPMSIPWEHIQRPFQRTEPILAMAPNDCPCCTVLSWWRAYAGKLIALRDLANDVGDVYDTERDAVRYRLKLEPAVNASALLYSFTWFAHALHRCLREVVEGHQDTDHWFRQATESGAVSRDMNSIELVCHRFEIDSFVYRFEVAGRRTSIGYSLDGAINALQQCHELRQRGPLWSAPHRHHSRWFAEQHDPWYVEMSRYLNTRRDAREWQFRAPEPAEPLDSQIPLFDESLESSAADEPSAQIHA